VNLIGVFNGTRVAVNDEAVARLVARVLEAEGVRGAEVDVELVGERRIRTLNAEYRDRDEVTDVLSFPLEEAQVGKTRPPGAQAGPPEAADPPRLLGDIVICARRALRQARADGLPPALELAVLLAHGTLHLLGYDHEVDAGRMALRQAEVLELVDWEALVVTPR
jgi:probable rRNA maturation factor